MDVSNPGQEHQNNDQAAEAVLHPSSQEVEPDVIETRWKTAKPSWQAMAVTRHTRKAPALAGA